MPRDSRLYMTFPIDFHRHPKLKRLPVDVRWTFVEMNGEARIADNDGFFAIEDAEFEWPAEHLARLVSSHPRRPLVVKTDTHYVLREFAEHQETRASREERRARNAANGAKGGRPRKNPPETQSVATRSPTKAESESESELEITTYVSESSHVSNRATEDEETTRQEQTARGVLEGGFNINPDRLIAHIRQRCDRAVTVAEAMRVATFLLDKGRDVKNPQGYVLTSITHSWAEVQKYIDEGKP